MALSLKMWQLRKENAMLRGVVDKVTRNNELLRKRNEALVRELAAMKRESVSFKRGNCGAFPASDEIDALIMEIRGKEGVHANHHV